MLIVACVHHKIACLHITKEDNGDFFPLTIAALSVKTNLFAQIPALLLGIHCHLLPFLQVVWSLGSQGRGPLEEGDLLGFRL